MAVSKKTIAYEVSPVSEGLWLVLRVGMVFGLIPLRRNSQLGKLDFKLSFGRSFPILYALYTLIANFLIFTFAVIIFFRDFGTEANLVEQFLDLVYHSHIIFTIIICIIQSTRIPKVLEEWEKVEILFRFYEELKDDKILFGKAKPESLNSHGEFIRVVQLSQGPHPSFRLKAKMISGGYAFSVLLGAVAYFIGINLKENCQTIQGYLDEVAKIYVIQEACCWWTGIYVLFIGHTMEFIWAYGDMLILSFSYGLLYQFRRFNKIIGEACKGPTLQPFEIEDLRLLHSAISNAAKRTRRMLSGLTTLVFFCNILYLFSRVYNGLEDDLSHPHLLVNIEAVYAFLYLIIRIFATAIMATKFYAASLISFRPLARANFYTNSHLHFLLTERFCTQVLTSNDAISGCGYFYVNQGFVAALLSALVTYEVIILQFSASSRHSIP